jgi:tRNA pseudouridine38-40 synthase
MIRYFLKLAYRGTAYHGWQVQENAHTVQAEINEKLSILLDEPINVVGCGRTDTGVHAREFYAHFEVEKPIKWEPDDFVFKLNRFLPQDIAVYLLKEVPNDLHARFSATSRTYRYYISQRKDPFQRDLSLEYTGALDLEAMQEAASYLKNYTDFTSFSKLHTQTATNNCKIAEAFWTTEGSYLVFTITADRFLRNMVRAIVGTLFEIGKGKMDPNDMKTVIEARNRSRAGFSVPAQGLFLEKIEYPYSF